MSANVPAVPRIPTAVRVRDLAAGVLSRNRSKAALVVVISLLAAVTATQSDVFFTRENFENILIQVSVVGILASGTTLLMVSGGIDLSIGSGVSVSGMVMGYLMAHSTSPAVAVALGLVAAALIGLTSGVLAAWSKSHPFIVTLGMLTLLQGLALLISNVPITDIPEGFLDLTTARPLGIPLVVFVFALVALAVHVLLAKTKYGRWLYAIGGSESAARRAGIPVRAVKASVYTLSGVLVGIAAALLIIQLSSAEARMGQGLELAAIAAVAVGGTPLAGGRGDMLGTLLGVFLIGLIGNALNLMSISADLQFVLQGAVIVVAVMAQRDS